MSKIGELWDEGVLPIKDGIYFSNGDSISLAVRFYPKQLIEKGDFFDLVSFLAENPDYLTNVDPTKIILLSNGDQCFLGEGSYGSEGFIAYKNLKGDLTWVMYFERSNPFINAKELSNNRIEVESSGNYQIVIELDNPTQITFSS